MNKKVCHITSAHNRYDTRIFIKECASLASENKYNVSLIVNDDLLNETNQGVHIVSTGFKAKNRAERFLKSKKLLRKKALEVNADIYHLHDPDLLPLGNYLKKAGKKVIFDSHEDVPQQIIDKEWLPKYIRSFVSNVYKIYEKKSISKYDAVVSVTPHIVERLSKINSKAVMITNYPIVNNQIEIKREPKLAICFAGGVGKQYHHEEIIRAIEPIEGMAYILAGNASDSYMKLLKSLPAWNKVDYRGRIPHSEVKYIYNESIAGMAVHYSNQAKVEGSLGAIKLFEFMEAKLPIICSNYRLWKEIIEGNNCGICVDPKNIKEIENAIRYIMDNPEEAKIMGENGRRVVLEKYNWDMQKKVLLGIYENL